MQLKTIRNRIKHTQLDVSMNLTKQPVFVPVWFFVALLGVVVSGLITIYKTQNVAVKEVAEQSENEPVNAVMVHNVKYYTYTIGTDSYSSREDFTPLFKRRIDKALKKEQEQIKNVLVEVSQYFAVKDTFDIKQKVRKNIRKSLALEVPQIMIDEYVPNLTKVDFQTSFNTEAMQTAKPRVVSGSLAQSFDNFDFENSKPTRSKQDKKTNCKNYIKRYKDIAIQEMKLHNIPASITLAQGLLESDAGFSRLAVDANNHFGIKCFSKSCKRGHCLNYTDDTHKDFFVVHKSVWSSYKARSAFLKKDRYNWLWTNLTYAKYVETALKHKRSLISLDKWSKSNRYEKVAHGLYVSQYATDKQYPQKLISIIKTYELDKFDKK